MSGAVARENNQQKLVSLQPQGFPVGVELVLFKAGITNVQLVEEVGIVQDLQ
jgi:hypothetical protein